MRLELLIGVAGLAMVVDGVLRKDDLRFVMIALGIVVLLALVRLRWVLRRHGVGRDGPGSGGTDLSETI